MRAGESFNLSNVAAATYKTGALMGGRYRLSITATWGGGNAILQQFLPDGTTAFTLFGNPSTVTGPGTQVGSLLADGVIDFTLQPGEHQIVITTASANYVSLTRIPLE